jgi:perosamine synthetase
MDFFSTHVSPQAIEQVNRVLESTWLSEGDLVKEFEAELAKVLGVVNPVAVNSGTSALHLALSVAGIGDGDEVILPAQTFIATGLAVLMNGAVPVFADIQYATGNMDPLSIEKKISERTRAVMPVHWGGYPCDLDEILSVASVHNLIVIEDAAHALGATYRKNPVGTISPFTVFSFQAIKHLTTGDGGALCCLSKQDLEAAKKRRWFNIDRELHRTSILGERVYDLKEIGYKYHMNNVAAAIGLGNLKDFHQRLQRRRETGEFYRRELQDVPGLELLDFKDDREHAYWIFTLLVEKRLDFIKKLKEHDIPSSVVHQGIDRNTLFGGTREDLVSQRRFDEMQISIPVHEKLTDDDLDHIVRTIQSGW